MIRAVLFDLYETLVARVPGTDEAFYVACAAADLPLYAELARAAGRDAADFARRLDEATTRESARARAATDCREPGGAEIVRLAVASLGVAAPDEWIEALLEREYAVDCDFHRPAAGAREVLDTLRAQGYRLGLVTNTLMPPRLVRAALERFGLLGAFECVSMSSEVGWRKPCPAIFEHALAGLGVAPTEAVMVGDLFEVDILGAQRLGCWTIHTRQFHHGQSDIIRPDATIARVQELLTLLCDGALLDGGRAAPSGGLEPAMPRPGVRATSNEGSAL